MSMCPILATLLFLAIFCLSAVLIIGWLCRPDSNQERNKEVGKMNKHTMTDLTLEDAVAQAQEALLGLREAERELGWQLAKEKLNKMGFLLNEKPNPTP